MNHVLMISLDPPLATQAASDTRQRHLAYAARAGHLTVITYTPPGLDRAICPSAELTILPSNSRSKLTFALDAIRLAQQAARDRPVDLITTQDPFLTGLIGVWLRRRWRVPLLVQNHSYIFGNVAWRAEHPRRNRLLETLGEFVVRRADFYRTVNRQERDHYITAGGSPERVIALPLGTASPEFAAPVADQALAALRAQLGLRPDQPVVLWIGYPVGFKRVPLLFQVFQQVAEPDARLVLIGDLRRSPDDLPALARDLGIADRVIMYGPVPHDDLPLYYALGSVYVHTSSYEGVPRVLFEASAAGLPLVGMQAVGVDEVIEDGVNGYLVPDGDVNGMAAQIVALLRDPAEAKILGAAARRLAFERYDADRYLDTWVQVWERAIELGLK